MCSVLPFSRGGILAESYKSLPKGLDLEKYIAIEVNTRQHLSKKKRSVTPPYTETKKNADIKTCIQLALILFFFLALIHLMLKYTSNKLMQIPARLPLGITSVLAIPPSFEI